MHPPRLPREEGHAGVPPSPQQQGNWSCTEAPPGLSLCGAASPGSCWRGAQGRRPGGHTDKLAGKTMPRTGRHTAGLPAAGPARQWSPVHSPGKHSQCDHGSLTAPGPPHDVRDGQGQAVTPVGTGRLQLPEEEKESVFMPVGTQATRDRAALEQTGYSFLCHTERALQPRDSIC